MKEVKELFPAKLWKLLPAAAVSALAFAALAAGSLGWSASAAAGPLSGARLYVSQAQGTDSGTCGPLNDPCKSIGQAVTNAAAGATILVVGGVYDEQVNVTKTLNIIGVHATVDATGLINGFLIGSSSGHVAAHTLVSGFTVKNAYGEGILVLNTTHVTIAHNTVKHNDLGAGTDIYPECEAQGGVPGDCGEGLHLMNTTNSQVLYNNVNHNSGGILLTDETAPDRGNLVLGNKVVENLSDCGITVVSHSTTAVDSGGHLQPSEGGTYLNNIIGNISAGNGGAGVQLAAAGPGAASYDNTVVGNYIVLNGHVGVTLHSHTPQQYLSGNKILGNYIGKNNLTGDSATDDDLPTAVLAFSAVVPVTGTVVAGNHIANDTYGVWLSQNAATTRVVHNLYTNVITDVYYASY